MKKVFAIVLAMVLALTAVSALAEDKVWVIKTDTAFAPFEYTDATGTLVGIDVEILAAIAADQGFQYEIESIGWDASIAACMAGQADGMIAGASITDARKESGWIFSDGYYNATQCMAVAADSDIKGFEELAGQLVSAKIGSMSYNYATSLAETYGFTVMAMESSPDVYQAVLSGVCVACFDDRPIMADNIVRNGVQLKLVEGTDNEPAAYGFAIFNPDNQELIDMFNAGLANIKANGVYDQILAKYLGE